MGATAGDAMGKVRPFILSGGSGTRLWPVSRRAFPKQFIPLVDAQSLLQKSCARMRTPLFAAPTILCNNEHRFLVAEQMQQMGLHDARIVLEPVARNTAPAALVAALLAAEEADADGEALVLLAPSDHIIREEAPFHAAVQAGLAAARDGHVVTFGIQPEGPETGYGYIETTAGEGQPAQEVQGTSVCDVVRFVEKPSLEKAQAYLKAGHFFWNAGIFLYSAQTMIDAFARHQPDILRHCRAALHKARKDLDFLRLDATAYARCESISIDYAIMEKLTNVKCAPLACGWSDLGAWPALWEVEEKDENANVARGDVMFLDTHDSYAHSMDGACLAVLGLQGVIAVATSDAVLVAHKSQAQKVKQIVDQLKQKGRSEADFHSRVYRPWGWYEGLSRGERYQVKCLMVKPGAQLSLQSHHHRAEHWVVVSGTARVTVGEESFLLTENESTYIPIGAKHRLGNPGKLPALLIEVQSGAYLGEDDIVRYEDDFNRENEAV